ncbi:unnamed protein product [Auanema sp. JU1783]|nr:unnamed protein product [Auanema sp. JU1783]
MADKSAFVPFDMNNVHRDNDANDDNMDIELFGTKQAEASAPAVTDERPTATQTVPSLTPSPTPAVSKPSPKKIEYKKSTTYKKTVAK